MPRLTAALLAAPILTGCSVGPDYIPPVLDMPMRWVNAVFGEAEAARTVPDAPAARPELAAWWREFRDPLLDALIAEAVDGNLDVARAKAAIRESRAALQQQNASLFPSLDGGGGAARARSNDSTRNSFRAGFDSAWELDLFGGNARSIEAAERGMEVAEADLHATLLSLVGDVGATYVELRGYQARLALARRTAASQRATAALTNTMFDAGSASALDVARALAQARSTEASIPNLEAAYAQALYRMGTLLGQPPGTLAARFEQARPIPVPGRFTGPGVPADILTARPDVRAAERQLAQATALVGRAEANRYPSITLSGTLSTSAARIGDLAKSSTIAWSIGPSLNVPIFAGGQLSAAVESMQAQRDRYYIAYRAAVLQALQDVESALVALAQERVRMARLNEVAAAQRQAAQLSRTLFQTGSSAFLDVLDAERSLFSSEDALLQSRIAIATNYIALNKALGGGWNGTVDATRPEIVDTDMGPRLRRAAGR